MSRKKEDALVVFQGKGIRRLWHNEEWYFSVVDVVGVLLESEDSRNYWKVLKHRLLKEGSYETVTNCNQLKMRASDGKMRKESFQCCDIRGALKGKELSTEDAHKTACEFIHFKDKQKRKR